MADSRTLTMLAWRRRGRTLTAALFGVSVALGLKAGFGIQPVASFFGEIQLVGEIVPGFTRWLEARPDVTGWLAGPVIFALLFAGFGALPGIRTVLERLIPDPPPFVRSCLDEARRRGQLISLEGPPVKFIGRTDALGELEALLEPDKAFAWRWLTGVSGIGKTRLGLEWLAAAGAAGWDVGILDRKDAASIEGWRPRRRTALMIDEARRDWSDNLAEAIVGLAGAARRGAPVRVVVVDQLPAGIDILSGEDRDRVTAAEVEPPLRLRGLNEDEIVELCDASEKPGALPAGVIAESAGLPRAALILLNSAQQVADYTKALSEWVDRLLPGLLDPAAPLAPGMTGPLLMASLGGPIDTQVAREICGQVDTWMLPRFYQDETPQSLEERLPALVPDDLAQQLLLRLLPRIDAALRTACVDKVLGLAPAAVEAKLSGIWRHRRDRPKANGNDAGPDPVQWLQRRFDTKFPDRVERLHEISAQAVNASTSENAAEVAEALGRIEDLADSRPFDLVIRQNEAKGAWNATYRYGKAGAIPELERWGDRLRAIVEDPRFGSEPGIIEAEINAAQNAFLPYGEIQDFDGIERWGRRLLAALSKEGVPSNPGLMDAAVAGMTRAAFFYGSVGNMEMAEKWADRIIAMAETAPFVDSVTFKRRIAGCAVNATAHYGAIKDFEGFERWAARAVAIGEDERFSGDISIRTSQAMIAVNGIAYYGVVQNFDALERWGSVLTGLVENPRLQGEPDIRLHEAKGAVNAIQQLGKGGLFAGLEIWGQRLIDLAADTRFAAREDIQTNIVMGASNAIIRYGHAARLGGVERWGGWLVNFVENEPHAENIDLRLRLAEVADNAIVACGDAADFEGVEHWGGCIVRLADDKRFAANRLVRVAEARTLFNLISTYGQAANFKAMERWGNRCRALEQDSDFIEDADLAGYLASSAANAISSYAAAGRQDWPRAVAWRTSLGRLARHWPGHRQIQSIANVFGLTAVSQVADRP